MNSEFKALLDLLSALIVDPRTGALIGLLLIAAWSDCRTGRIPNWLVFGGAVLGLASNALAPTLPGGTWPALASALNGLACGLVLTLPFYLLRAMGAGDVKLMAMTGAFLGFPAALWAGLATFLAGGVLAIAWLAWKKTLRRAMQNIAGVVQRATHGSLRSALRLDAAASAGSLPYGLAIAAGTIAYLVLRQLGFVSW